MLGLKTGSCGSSIEVYSEQAGCLTRLKLELMVGKEINVPEVVRCRLRLCFQIVVTGTQEVSRSGRRLGGANDPGTGVQQPYPSFPYQGMS